MSKKTLWLLPAMLLLVGAACANKPAVSVPANQNEKSVTPAQPGSSSTKGQENQPTIAAKNFTVLASEFEFTPKTITVTTNDDVRILLKNNGTTDHTLVITEFTDVTTKILKPGEEDAVAFRAPSTPQILHFYCSMDSHQALGMQGTIIVK